MSTSDKLLYLQDTKSAIKDAIVAKGISVPNGTPFRQYADKIGDITTESADWIRPTEWLSLPDNVDGVQKVSILNAVFDTDSEFVAMIFEGTYTVDWGDGTVENFASGVKAEHKYEYSNVNLNSDTVANFGYKQCIITVTPQVGNSLTLINLNTYHSVIGSSKTSDIALGFLDIRINSLSCTALLISKESTTLTTNYVGLNLLKQCVIGELSMIDFSYLFYICFNMESVSIKDTSMVENFSFMHQNNYMLKKAPVYDFSNTTAINGMYSACYALESVPDFNITNKCINLSSIFSSCYILKKAPSFSDSSGATDVSNMFSNCRCLVKIPSYVFNSASNVKNFVTGCTALGIVPNINFGEVYVNSPLNNLPSLKRMLTPLKLTFSVANAKMSATALNEMYSILPTVTGQTVTVTGNYGVRGDDPTIATSKGWTVVG